MSVSSESSRGAVAEKYSKKSGADDWSKKEKHDNFTYVKARKKRGEANE